MGPALPGRACGLAIALAVVLAGCSAPLVSDQPSRGDPEACLATFLAYDRAVWLYPANRFGSDDTPAPMLPAPVARPARLLVEQGCLTSSADLDGMPALATKLAGHRVVDSGPAIRPTALHLGIVTGIEDERQATRFFRGLGYRSRGVGAPTLGRRLYIGPFVSQGALDEAIAIAKEAGFIAPFPAPHTQF